MTMARMPDIKPYKTRKARVLIVEDQPIVREKLVELISSQIDLMSCGDTDNPRGAFELIATTINDDTMTVNLTGVANAQKIIVTLSNVTDAYGRTLASAKVPMGILLGDVDGNKTVNNTDVNNVTAKVGATAGLTNFRDDVDTSGSINQIDVNIT